MPRNHEGQPAEELTDNVQEIANDAEKYDFGAKIRPLTGWQFAMVSALGVLYSAFHLAVLNILPLDEWVFRAIHVNMAAVIAFTVYSTFGRSERSRAPWWDLALGAMAIVCTAYIWWQLDGLIVRTGVMMTTWDVIIATVGIFIVIEFARRSAGLALPILAMVFLLYGIIGPWLPGVLFHRGFGFGEFTTFVYSMEGVFGITTAAAAQYIVLFVTFAAFLQVSKVGDLFMNLAFAAMGRARGGPAKAAVAGSIFFGMISGSGVANVVASGTFTIPVMRRVGYPRSSAGAIEAAASTGGQLAPPIMGAGAFIMAEITGIPYTHIALAAIPPCLLYYLAVYIHVDLEAIKKNIHGLPRSELPKFRPMLREIFLLLPLGTLLAFLITGYSIIAAGSWGVATAVLVLLRNQLALDSRWLATPLVVLILAIVLLPGLPANTYGVLTIVSGFLALTVGYLYERPKTALFEVFGNVARDILKALEQASRQSLQLAAVCACAGIIVGVIGLTGLGGRFSALLLSVAGQSEIIALICAMLVALILGMGMPTTAAYAIAASVVAPSLQRMGIEPLSAHFFVFYYAVISTITPPIALSAFAGAALAGANPWKTSFKSVRYGIAAFIVPFLFVYHDEILMQGEWYSIIQVVTTAAIAVWMIAIASEGWFRGALNPLMRVLFTVAAVCLFAGGIYTDLIGLALGACLIKSRYFPAGRLAQ
ncbi:TRAP transporter permease [Billgrantia endophytica]|uniref:C4-dicarboxylate ABC transporter permease n=1 Tax=Billgrantia endophytica TaxID=2033802 RepID=A0A2N7U0Q9_9GAMM|nr:TRAP transporter permease [Halomonas endophytica]PMR74027.1 C4-dicarboxylate ABC transporter permease [Halomonas endophytica]